MLYDVEAYDDERGGFGTDTTTRDVVFGRRRAIELLRRDQIARLRDAHGRDVMLDPTREAQLARRHRPRIELRP